MNTKSVVVLLVIWLNNLLIQAQTYTHPTTGIQSTYTGTCMANTCSGTYYDNGGNGGSCSSSGSAGNYSNSINGVLRTFCPNSAGQVIRITFPTFCVEGGTNCPYEYFQILNGPTQNSTVLAAGCGTSLQGQTFTSSHPSGCLTFRFWSDNLYNYTGWVGNISCVTPSSGTGPSATSNADCTNATGICSNGFAFTGLSTGPGLTSDGCNGCVTSENFSNWYEFTIATSGSLGFTINPTPNSCDYDFSLYQANSCGSLSSPVRCSYAATTGNTGLGNGANDASEDVNGNGWVSTLNVTAGQHFYLMINEWTPNNGSFILNWTGTATIQTPVPDFLISSTTYSNGSNYSVCQNGAFTINASGAGGSTYTWWTASTGGTQIASGASYSPPTSTAGSTIYYLQETTASGCVSPRSAITVTVIATPTISTVTSQTICAGQQTTAITFSGTASTYNWSNSNTAIGLGASGTGNIVAFTGTNSGTTAISGTITVTPVSGTCTGTPITFSITVNPVPTITTPQNQTICAGQQTTAITFSGTSGATYTWSNDNTSTGLGASGNGNIAAFTGTNTFNASITSNITVTPTLGTCPGTPVTFTITVSVTPTISTVTSQTICAGQQTTAITFSGTASTYNWSNSNTAIGLGASGTGNIVAFTGTNSGTTAISGTITVTPVSGTCTGTPITFSITVNPVPTITTPQNQTICAGQQTTAITFSGTSGATYTWSNDNTSTGLGASGNGNIAAFTGTNTFNASITSNITVTPTLGTCPGTPVTFTITVAVTPTISTVTSQTICAGQQTTAITFSGTATTYNWSNSNTAIGLGASGNGDIAAFTGTNSGTTAISGTITVIPVSGTCSGTPITFSITVNPVPTITTPQNQTICTGQQTTAITFSGTSGATYTWSNDNTTTGLGASGNGNIAAFTGTNTSNASITSNITVTPTLGTCPGTPVTFSITVAVTPTISTVTSQTICAGQQTTAITFSGTATTYNWSNSNTNIGLGASGTGNIAAFTGTNTGSSAISGTITVTPVSGTCTGTPVTFSITVNNQIIPTFTQLGPYCQNSTPGVLATSSTNSPAIVGIWSPTTISTSAVGNQLYTFTPNTGQCATTTSMTIITSQVITPTFTQLGPYCQNTAQVTLPTSSTNSPVINGTWSSASVSTITVGTTTYTFTPAANQCAGSATMSIVINAQPTITVSSQTICAGQSATLNTTANPTGGTYLWSNNQTTASITVTPNATATYSVLYVLNSCNTSSSATVTVNPIINPNFSALGPYCQNTVPGNFVNTSTNGISGSWNPSSITTSSPGNQIYTFTPTTGQCASTASMTVVITPLTTPTFNTIGPLCLNSTAPFLPLNSTNLTPINGTWNPSTISTATIGTTSYTFSPNAGQCAISSTINITIENAPIPSIQTTTTQGCAPLSVTLSSSNLPNTIYNWESNGVNIGTGATVNTVFTNAGCYDISLQITANGCSSNSTYTDYICVENTPNASFTATPNSFTETNQDVYFGNNSSNAVNYNWYFGDGDSSSLFEPNHLYTNITNNMQVTLVAMSAFGCIDNYTLTIPFKDDLVYYVPNTFTPDGDEHNQAWGPVFTKGFDPYNFHLLIFNRWGELIWESNDANAKWDGTYGIDGKKVQQGTYTYKIKFQSKETDKKYTITGNIYLLK